MKRILILNVTCAMIFAMSLRCSSVVAQTTTRYAVDAKYKNAYVHQKQKTYDGTGGCSWTSYVLAAAAIIRGKGNLNYPDKAGGYDAKIQHCFDWCNVKDNQVSGSGRTGIATIESYCKKVDQNAGYPIQCVLQAFDKSNHQDAAERMVQHINSYHTPFLFIGAANGIGHYLICWTIDWSGSPATSIVYYTDTAYASNDNNFREANLETFLSNNVMDYINFLFLY